MQKNFNFITERKQYKRKHNTRYINVQYMYSIKDITSMLHVHSRTVSSWIAKGLQVYHKGIPYLICGKDLKEFLDVQSNKDKINTLHYEFACFKCRASRKPLDNNIEVHLHNTKIIHLKGICRVCNTKINKSQHINKLSKWMNLYKVTNMKQIEAVLRLYTNLSNTSSSI